MVGGECVVGKAEGCKPVARPLMPLSRREELASFRVRISRAEHDCRKPGSFVLRRSHAALARALYLSPRLLECFEVW